MPGDIVTFTTADGVFDYAVTFTEIVAPDALWIIDPSDTPTATLFACHPPGSTVSGSSSTSHSSDAPAPDLPAVTVWPPCPTPP